MTPYYSDDFVTIYHGDCRDVLPGLAADAIVTDPPFKLSQEYATNADADNLIAVAGVKDAAALMLQALQPGGLALVFYDNRLMPFGLESFMRAGWQYQRMLAFYRRWGNAHQLAGWMSTTDPVLLFAKPGAKPTYYGDWMHDCYIRDTAEAESVGHPAQKPLTILQQMIGRICPTEGTLLDPYCGSGSSLVAARNMGRFAIGIEREERYCEMSARRFDQQSLDLWAAS